MDQIASMDDAVHASNPALTNVLALITDSGGRVKSVSRGLCELLGMKHSELVEHDVQELRAHLRDSAPLTTMREAVRDGHDWHGQVALRGGDGRDHRVECMLTRVADAHHERGLYAAIGHEVAVAAPVVHSNRLRMLGQVSAGVLHDLNNVVAAMLGHAELARAHAQAGRLPRLARSLDEVSAAGELCRDIAGTLLDLLHERPRAAQGPVALDQVVQLLARLLRPTLAGRAELRVSVPTPVAGQGISTVAAEQCLLNLAVNARDALGEQGGVITLSALSRQKSNGNCAACGQAVSGEHVALVCEDNGPGLPPDFQPRAFDAFATTRGRSGGSGLGLAIIAELVHRAGGHILLRSNPVEGTRFTLLFEPA